MFKASHVFDVNLIARMTISAFLKQELRLLYDSNLLEQQLLLVELEDLILWDAFMLAVICFGGKLCLAYQRCTSVVLGGTLHEDCTSVMEEAYVAAVLVQSVAISGILVPMACGRSPL